ncbi:MAG: hypothetical protein QM775_12640 [Pirellulales bacterium]
MTPEDSSAEEVRASAAELSPEIVQPVVEPRPLPPPLAEQLRICTHNPLYVVSAALVVYGLLASFPVGSGSPTLPLLAICLAAYVVLLAGTAWFLRRLGVLWEDLRMLGLLAVLLLPMVGVALDHSLQASPNVGRAWFGCAALFAALIGEALVVGLRMRLPWGYRAPYHLLMTLFFAWPVLVQPLAVDPYDATLQWLLFGFAAAAGAILLMLLPAIWLGPAYVRRNGTPWRWPWYPLTIFVPLVICAVGRAYYLCETFHSAAAGQTIFAPYFLAPLVWAIAILFLVGGMRHRRPLAIGLGLVLPAAAILLSPWDLGETSVAREFLDKFQAALGAMPPRVVTIGSAFLYAVALAARTPGAFACLVSALLALATVDAGALKFLAWKTSPDGLPALIAAALLTTRGALRRQAWFAALGAAVFWLAVHLFGYQARELPVNFTAYYSALAICVAQAWWISGERALPLRLLTALMLLWTIVDQNHAHGRGLLQAVPAWLFDWYAELLVLLSVGIAALLRDRIVTMAAGFVAANYFVRFGGPMYRRWKLHVAGLDAIVAGIVTFIAAVGLSLYRRRRDAVAPSQGTPPPISP